MNEFQLLVIQSTGNGLNNHLNLNQLIVIFAGISLLLLTSGSLVRYILKEEKDKSYEDTVQRRLIHYDTMSAPVPRKDKKYVRDYTGVIIGKCEKYISICFHNF